MAWSDKAIPNHLLAWIPNAARPADPKKKKACEDGLRRLEAGLEKLPLPYGFSESILGLRAIVRAQRAEEISVESALRLIHRLAVIESFDKPREEWLPGVYVDVFETMPPKFFQEMELDWDAIGCEKLEALNKTDRKWMVDLWGPPLSHTTAYTIYQSDWQKIQDEYLSKRAAESGETVEDYLARQRQMYARYAEEDELRRQSRNAEQELRERAGSRAAAASDQPVFLDLETTGLSSNEDEILEIGIVDHNGDTLLEQLIKPEFKTEWPEAQQINGISPRDVRDAPTLASVEQSLIKAVSDRLVVIYNAPFDVSFLPTPVVDSAAAFVCAMDLYRSSVKKGRARLSDAEKWAGFQRGENRRHRAIGDASATLHVWNKLKDHHGDKFFEAVAGATISPEAEAMKGERITQDQERHTITFSIGGVLENVETPPAQFVHARPNPSRSSNGKWILIGLAIVLALAFLGWLAK